MARGIINVSVHDFSNKGDTWPKVLKYNSEHYGNNHRAFRYKHYGTWEPYTWMDYFTNVKQLALGLLALGFNSQDKLLIIGDNAPEWYFAELAAQSLNGISVGVYSELLPSEIRYVANNSDARFAIVEDQEQVDKLLEIREDLPLLEKVIYWNPKGLAHYDDRLLLGYRQALQQGEEYFKENPTEFEKKVEAGKADDVCAIVYTSGTTGDNPKGVLHTYKSLMGGALFYLHLDTWSNSDNVVPYVPPSWITEQWFGIGCHLLSACTLNFAESPETQQRDIKETKPSIIYSEARLWESHAAKLQARILDADRLKRFAFRKLMPVGYRFADLKQKRVKPGLWTRILYSIASLILFRPIKKDLGLINANICYSTGSMLSIDAMKFYHALNLPLKSLYFTTEGGALTGAKDDDILWNTVGPVHEEAEIKISDSGEIIYRHPGISKGYYKDQVKTSEAFKEGWFHTGDSGFINDEGHLVFTDRLKAIYDLSNGNKLAPQSIESRLRFSPYVIDAWVIAGKHMDHTSAIIVINYDSVSKWAGQNRVAFNNFLELSQAAEVYDLIKADIEKINQDLPDYMRIRRFLNLHKTLDPDEGELTRNRKLRRDFLKERYARIVEALNEDKAEALFEAEDSSRDGQITTNQITIKISSV